MKRAVALSFFPLALGGLCSSLAGAEPARPTSAEQWSSLEPQTLKAPVAVALGRNPLQPLSSSSAVRPLLGERAELGERIARCLSGRIKSVIRDGDRSIVFIGSRSYSLGQEVSVAQEGERSSRSLKVVLKRVEAECLVFLVTYSSSPSVLPADIAVPLDPFCRAR